jgi:hypothetical protein
MYRSLAVMAALAAVLAACGTRTEGLPQGPGINTGRLDAGGSGQTPPASQPAPSTDAKPADAAAASPPSTDTSPAPPGAADGGPPSPAPADAPLAPPPPPSSDAPPALPPDAGPGSPPTDGAAALVPPGSVIRADDIEADVVRARVIYAREIRCEVLRIDHPVQSPDENRWQTPGGPAKLTQAEVVAEIIYARDIRCRQVEASEAFAKKIEIGR